MPEPRATCARVAPQASHAVLLANHCLSAGAPRHASARQSHPEQTHWSISAASAADCGARGATSSVILSGGSTMSFLRTRRLSAGLGSTMRPPAGLNRPPPPPPMPPPLPPRCMDLLGEARPAGGPCGRAGGATPPAGGAGGGAGCRLPAAAACICTAAACCASMPGG